MSQQTGSLFFLLDRHENLEVWDVANDRCIYTMSLPAPFYFRKERIIFSPDERELFIEGDYFVPDRRVDFINQRVHFLSGFGQPLVYSTAGTYYVYANSIYFTAGGDSVPLPVKNLKRITFADNESVCGISNDSALYIFNLKKKEWVGPISLPSNKRGKYDTNEWYISPDGHRLVINNWYDIHHSYLILYNTHTGAHIQTLTFPKVISSVDYHPSAGTFVVCCTGAFAAEYDENGNLLRKLNEKIYFYQTCFSPDGDKLIASSLMNYQQTIYLYPDMRPIGTYEASWNATMQFSPDAKRVLMGNDLLVDIPSRMEIVNFFSCRYPYKFKFLNDKELLYWEWNDGSYGLKKCQVYDIAPLKLRREKLEHRFYRPFTPEEIKKYHILRDGKE